MQVEFSKPPVKPSQTTSRGHRKPSSLTSLCLSAEILKGVPLKFLVLIEQFILFNVQGWTKKRKIEIWNSSISVRTNCFSAPVGSCACLGSRAQSVRDKTVGQLGAGSGINFSGSWGLLGITERGTCVFMKGFGAWHTVGLVCGVRCQQNSQKHNFEIYIMFYLCSTLNIE